MLRSKADIKNPVVVYFGEINSEIISNLIAETEKKLEEITGNRRIQQKTVSIAVEFLQNVHNYLNKSNSHDNEWKSCRFFIFFIKGNVEITTGNLIHKNDMVPLKEWIEKINRLSADQLKELYRSSLRMSAIKGNERISLGLIEIARKSGNPIECKFDNTGKEYSYVNLKARIDIKKN